eukprot:12406113-Karenia_brevis.AAC.1
MQFISGIIRQWVPIHRFLTITAIIPDTAEFVTDTPTIISSLASHCAPFLTGEHSSFDEGAAREVLACANLSPNWDWSKMRLPNSETFQTILKHCHDSGVGYDGLTYSAHSSTSEISAVLLEDVFRKLRSFNIHRPFDVGDFNFIVQSSIPKKAFLPYENGIACRADETRQLACKNTDNK